MAWCNNSRVDERAIQIVTSSNPSNQTSVHDTKNIEARSTITCPSCGHKFQDQAGIHDLPGLPAGVRFDPNDQEILEHLESKVLSDSHKIHPLIDEFIPTIDGENGICYTHPEKLPGVNKDGQVRHFFHRPSKAYTTGTRKRRKVHTDADGSETRWHKTGKTRPVVIDRSIKGHKKILVLYTNYGRQKKPEKTNWVMHQYHLGNNEEEKDGELVVSKIFYQTQPRQCSSSIKIPTLSTPQSGHENALGKSSALLEYYNPHYISFDQGGRNNRESPPQLIPNLVAQADASSLIQLSAGANIERNERK